MNFTIGDTPEQLNTKLAHIDSALLVDGFVYTQESVRQLKSECLRLEACLASKTEIANQLKDGLAEAFEREMNLKAERDALAAQVETITKDRDDWQSAMARAASVLLLHKVPTKKINVDKALAEIRAEAVLSALDHCEDSVTIIADAQRDKYETIKVCWSDELKQYAEKIRQGGVK